MTETETMSEYELERWNEQKRAAQCYVKGVDVLNEFHNKIITIIDENPMDFCENDRYAYYKNGNDYFVAAKAFAEKIEDDDDELEYYSEQFNLLITYVSQQINMFTKKYSKLMSA